MLDKNFVFSANNLQDYRECPRLFELKYLLKQSWPAIVSQPVQELEDKIARGSQFHRMVRQFLEGLPPETLRKMPEDPRVLEWFDRFLQFISPYTGTPYRSEYASVTRISGYRVVAVFDFITRFEDGQIIIMDWKTTEREPRREFYQDRIQTLLYPLVAFDTAPAIFDHSIEVSPEDISLLYWFPAFPEKSLEFSQTAEQKKTNRGYIEQLILEIAAREPGEFPKTENLNRCKYCRYRSLCERGIKAGAFDQAEEFDLDAFIENMSFDNSSDIRE